MDVLDLRGQEGRQALDHLCRAYDAAAPGTRFEAIVDELSPRQQMRLIEGGVRFDAAPTRTGEGGAVRLVVTRARASVSNRGPHHVIALPDGAVLTCDRRHTAARIDGETGRLLATGAVADAAGHLAADPTGRWLFVADPGGNALTAVDSLTLRVEHRWSVPGRPQLPLVTDDGVVCVAGPDAGTVTVLTPTSAGGFDVRTYAVGGGPHDPVPSLDGRFLFVPCVSDGYVVKLRIGDGTIVGRLPVGEGPSHIAMHPRGDRIYVANTFSGDVACVSTDGEILGKAYSGRWAHVPDVTPDGRWLFVANFFDDTIAVFDAQTLERRAVLPTEAYPHDLTISPDGRLLIATGVSSDSLRIYDAATQAELARVAVGEGSSHSAFVAEAGRLFVGCAVAEHVAVVDPSERTCTDRIHLAA